jgi:hypothetical protein
MPMLPQWAVQFAHASRSETQLAEEALLGSALSSVAERQSNHATAADWHSTPDALSCARQPCRQLDGAAASGDRTTSRHQRSQALASLAARPALLIRLQAEAPTSVPANTTTNQHRASERRSITWA